MLNKVVNKSWSVALILSSFGILIYANVLNSGFKIFDDNFVIVNNALIKSPANIFKFFGLSYFGGGHYYRPLTYMAYTLEYMFFGLDPFYYHLTNLFIHLLIAVSVYFLLRLLLKDERTAFLTAFLFVIHPINSEAVFNIADRAILLSTFFVISSFFILIVKEEKNHILWRILSLAFFLLGFFSKESAMMFPLLVFFYFFVYRSLGIKAAGRKVLPYFLFLSGYILLRNYLGITKVLPWHSSKELALGFATFLGGVLDYFRLFVLPIDLYFDRSMPLFYGIWDIRIWISLILWAAIIFIAIKNRQKISKVVLFFVLWVALELVPVSQLFSAIGVAPGVISLAEHFVYTASIPAFVLLVLFARYVYEYLISRKISSSRTLKFAFYGYIVFIILMALRQSYINSDTILIFRNSAENNPHNTRAMTALGLELGKKGRYNDAEVVFSEVLKRDPFMSGASLGLGKALCDQGKLLECLSVYESIPNAGRWNELLAQNKYLTYLSVIEKYKKRLVADADNPQLFFSLGVMCLKVNNSEEAIMFFQKAVRLNPKYKEALYNLSVTYDALGMREEALESYSRLDAISDQNDEYKEKISGRIKLMQEGL